jgi:hypothetical protein
MNDMGTVWLPLYPTSALPLRLLELPPQSVSHLPSLPLNYPVPDAGEPSRTQILRFYRQPIAPTSYPP